MDSVSTAHPALSGGFFLSSLSIILINIVLSGDNSVVIAMAVHGLPKPLRIRGIIIGTAGAVLLRVFFTLVASHLLEIPFIKLAGGLAILWIAIKLLLGEEEDPEGGKQPTSLWSAVWIILVADLTMSIDNVLAVAGVSHGNMVQLWLSLGLSIPLVVFASTLLSNLMDRFPIILVGGAALLGKVGGEMIITDPGLANLLRIQESTHVHLAFETFTTLAVLFLAWRIRRRHAHPSPPGSGHGPSAPAA